MKTYMKTIVTMLVLFFIIVVNQHLFAQPMSGSYTIGGTSPDFTSISQAVSVLSSNGVAGSVALNIRPGIYEEQIIIPEIIGASTSNTITFRSETGNADDVVWQFESSDWQNFNYVVRIDAADHLRFQNLTFSSDLTNVTGGGGVVIAFHNGLSENVIISDNVFNGIPYALESKGVINDYHSISFPTTLKNLKILNNTFFGFGDGIKLVNVTGDTSNSGLEILNNSLESSISDRGIYVRGFLSPRIENNIVKTPTSNQGLRTDDCKGRMSLNNNYVIAGKYGIYIYGVTSTISTGGLVSNNMVITNAISTAGSLVLNAYVDSLMVAHNSFVSTFSGPSLRINSTYNSNRLAFYNNIFINTGSGKALISAGPPSSVDEMDYNVLFTAGSVLANWDGVDYATLPDLQNASGMNLNSVSKMPDFENPEEDLHLIACSIGDEDLKGIPVPGVVTDYDGQIRDVFSPYIGADETYADPPHLFAGRVAFGVNDSPVHFAAGDLDGDDDSDIAVVLGGTTNKVEVYWNDNGNFSSSTVLDFGLLPTIVKIADLDADNINDLVCLSDTIFIRYGMGGGIFTPPVKLPGVGVNVNPPPHGDDFDILDIDDDGELDIIQTYLGTVGVETGYLAIYFGDGNRDFTFYEASQPDGLEHPSAIKLADMNNDDKPEAIVVDYVNGSVGVFENILPDISVFLDAVVYNTNNTGSSALHANFDVYDFDGNNFNDIMVGDWDQELTDSLIFLQNDGSTPFIENISGVMTDDYRSSVIFTAFDYELDGDKDILYATQTNEISILVNDGSGNFEPIVTCNPVGGNSFDGTALTMLNSDFNNDNFSDIAVLTQSDSFYIYYNAGWIPTGLGTQKEDTVMIAGFELAQNYPNPFNPSTNIRYSVSERSNVLLKIYDILGSEVSTLVNEAKERGVYSVNFNASHLASGIYFYRLQSGSYIETKKMILLR